MTSADHGAATGQRHAGGRIAVVGAGALGQLYAASLARAAPGSVTLFTRRPEAQALLRKEIAVFRQGGVVRQQGVDVRLLDEAPDVFDLVLVLVSAYDTVKVAPLVARLLRDDGICLSLQNGLGNQDALAKVVGDQRAAGGATSFAVHLQDTGAVHVDGEGITWVPALPAHLEWFPPLLAAAGLNPSRIDDARQLLWRKVATGTNGYVSLILGTPFGLVARTASGREIAWRASQDVIRLAAANGISITEAEVRAALEKAWTTSSPDARSSLYSDYVAGKPTEVEERLGDLVDRARQFGVPVPTIEAMLLLARTRLELRAAGSA